MQDTFCLFFFFPISYGNVGAVEVFRHPFQAHRVGLPLPFLPLFPHTFLDPSRETGLSPAPASDATVNASYFQ